MVAITAGATASLFEDIKTNRDRLHSIEWDIAVALQQRPMRTWCDACFRMFGEIHRKATGADL